jgi:hypothetical protein
LYQFSKPHNQKKKKCLSLSQLGTQNKFGALKPQLPIKRKPTYYKAETYLSLPKNLNKNFKHDNLIK